MINTKDLRRGNWVRTEYGICKVAYVIWNDVYVYAKDNRTNYAREVEGIGIGEILGVSKIDSLQLENIDLSQVLKHWLFIHELQNFYYWNNGKELIINL